MLRSSIYTAGVVLLGASAFAQRDMKSNIQPITSPIKNAGVYHLGTGTWTRAASPGALGASQSVIYDNTCDSGYFGAMIQNEKWTDEGRLPTIAANGAPTTPNAVGVPGGYDAEPGCQTSYTIEAFQMGYCSNSLALVSFNINFQESYNFCAVAAPQQLFAVTGLPGGTGIGGQNCWIVTLDLIAASATFAMQADGNGTAADGGDLFGWDIQLTSAPPAINTDGPIIAGGIDIGGTFATCSGTDGTRWDTLSTNTPLYPANQPVALGGLEEPGTGMGNVDAFRVENAAVAPGCYFFLGNPRGSFHLELYATAGCAPASVLTPYCTPGQAGVVNCPCGVVSNPVTPNTGCENYNGTGGGQIGASGTPTAAAGVDTMVFTGSNIAPTSGILMQGTTFVAAGISPFGNGVRCVSGLLKRLYTKTAPGGTFTAPTGADPTVWDRSAALGDTIAPGTTREYMIYYREQNTGGSIGTCVSGPGQFNATNAGSVTWL